MGQLLELSLAVGCTKVNLSDFTPASAVAQGWAENLDVVSKK